MNYEQWIACLKKYPNMTLTAVCFLIMHFYNLVCGSVCLIRYLRMAWWAENRSELKRDGNRMMKSQTILFKKKPNVTGEIHIFRKPLLSFPTIGPSYGYLEDKKWVYTYYVNGPLKM